MMPKCHPDQVWGWGLEIRVLIPVWRYSRGACVLEGGGLIVRGRGGPKNQNMVGE